MWKNNNRGFSLLELTLVMAIIALLASISLSQYQSFLRKSRRSDAHTSLLAYHAQLQQCYVHTYNYLTCLQELNLSQPQLSFNQYYTLQSTDSTKDRYTLQATAQGEQTKDLACYRFTLNSLQQTQAYTKEGQAASTCWPK